MKPFMQDHLTKLKNKKVIVPVSVRTAIDDLEAMREKQLETSVSDRVVVSKVPIPQKIASKLIEIWNLTSIGQLKCKVESSPSISAFKKMNSACEHIKTMNKERFEPKINSVPQSLCKCGKNGIELYHASKVKITKQFKSTISVMTKKVGLPS